MTKCLQNFLAIVIVIEIVCKRNGNFAYPDVTFFCLEECTQFEVSNCFVVKYFYVFILALLYAVA